MTDTRILVEVEATPALIREQLDAWYARNRNTMALDQFPHAEGTFLRFTPDMAVALGVNPENPIRVVSVTRGAPQGLVAFFNAGGVVQAHHFSAAQVRPAEDPPAETDSPDAAG